MQRFRVLLALGSLALGSALHPQMLVAAGFTQSWATGAWWYEQTVGSSDSDAQPEMVFSNKGNGRYAIFDAATGAIEEEFPAYNHSNSTYGAGDLDGDGLVDFVFHSLPDVVPPFFRVVRWNGSDYVTLLSHSDSVATFSVAAFRTTGQLEIAEVSGVPDDPTNHPTCDFRLRDLSGNVLFRASTDVPGWSRPLRGYSELDRTEDGVQELVLEDQASVRVFHQYDGDFSVAWTLPGWSRLTPFGNLDGDPQTELLATSNADGHFAIVDASTGTIQQEFPALTFGTDVMSPQNVDGDDRLELVSTEYGNGLQPPVFSIHDWNGSSFAPLVSVTATGNTSNFAIQQLRSPTQYEIMELTSTDVFVRDLAGALLFRASTDIPGWSVTPFTMTFQLLDADGSGMPDLLLYDDTHVWDVRYNGAFALAWAANGWRLVQDAGNLDSDTRSELVLSGGGDGRFGIFDGVTGTMQQEFPDFRISNSTYFILDTDANGALELYFGRLPGETPLFRVYEWNGSTYGPRYSHTQPMGTWFPVQLRSASQFEFLEVDQTDIRVRDLSATVIFRASTDLPGWAGLPNPFASPGAVAPGADVYNLFVIDSDQFRVVIHDHTTGVPGSPGATAFRVFQNVPNPFRAETGFRISMSKAGPVGIRIFDAGGRLVRRLDRKLPVGTSEIHWDGRDDEGRNAPSGVLFYQVTVDGVRQTRKLILTQ